MSLRWRIILRDKGLMTKENLPAIEGGAPVRENFLTYSAPIIEEEAIESVVETLRSGWVGTGPKVKLFEEEMAKFLGVDNALALNSCTAALHMALVGLGVGPGDEVIVPDMTFCATVNSVMFTGAKPVFVDVDYETMNMTVDTVRKALSPRTKVILPVHMAGLPVDLDPILTLARKKNLYVIEDAAHAVEALYKGKRTGSIGDFGCYSFYVTKNLTTAEGGMLVTNDSAQALIARQASLHGMSADAWKRFSSQGFKHYEVVRLGYKYNMTDIQAAMGLVHMKYLDRYWKRRTEIWFKYNNAFSKLALKIPAEVPKHYAENSSHSRHLYIIKLELDKLEISRDKFMAALQKENIGVGIHYRALHEHPLYVGNFGLVATSFPNASKLSSEILSLPLSPKMTDEEVDDVIKAVTKLCEYYASMKCF